MGLPVGVGGGGGWGAVARPGGGGGCYETVARDWASFSTRHSSTVSSTSSGSLGTPRECARQRVAPIHVDPSTCCTPRHGTVRHSIHGVARHGTDMHATAWHGTAWHSMVRHSCMKESRQSAHRREGSAHGWLERRLQLLRDEDVDLALEYNEVLLAVPADPS